MRHIRASKIRILSAVSLLVVLSLVPAMAQQPNEATPSSRADALVSKIWWNQEAKIAELELRVEQRVAMDEILRDFLENRRTQDRNQQTILDAFGESLAKGNTESAEELAAEFGQSLATPATAQLKMMAVAVGQLSAEQRQLLHSKYPRLLSRLWIRSANPRSGMLGRSRRSGERP